MATIIFHNKNKKIPNNRIPLAVKYEKYLFISIVLNIFLISYLIFTFLK